MQLALYQERLLAEYRAPKNRRVIEAPTHSVEHRNPLCGDAIHVMLCLNAGRISEVAFTGQACSIAVASASFMTQLVAQQNTVEAHRLIMMVERVLGGSDAPDLPPLLDPLRATVRFSARHGCVLMPWLALREALG